MSAMVEDRYQRLAAKVSAAGGRLGLPRDAVPSRLGRRVDPGDAYAVYVLKRDLEAVGLTAEFRADGGVDVFAPTKATAPPTKPTAPPTAPTAAPTAPAGPPPGPAPPPSQRPTASLR